MPKRLLKPNKNIQYSKRFKYVFKNIIFSNNTINKKFDNIIIKNNNIEIRHLLLKLSEMQRDIDKLIIQKNKLIKNMKINNIYDILINSFLKNEKSKKIKTVENSKNEEILDIYQIANARNKFIDVHNNTETFCKITGSKTFSKDSYLQSNTEFLLNKENKIKIVKTKKSMLNLTTISNTASDINPLNDNVHNDKTNFDCKTDPISVNSPVNILYFPSIKDIKTNTNHLNTSVLSGELDKKPIINHYLKSMSIYNMKISGTFVYFSNIIGFNFNSESNKLIKNIYKLLSYFFKTMYCLISKPVFVFKTDKIIIQLFYFLLIPNLLKKKKYKFNKFFIKKKYRNKKKLNNKKYSLKDYNLTKFKKKAIRKFKNLNTNKKIKLRKLSNVSLIKLYPEKFKILCEILNNFFKKNIELDLIRVHYPYNDSNILVNLIAMMIKKVKIRKITRKIFRKAVMKSIKTIFKETKISIIPAFLTGLTIKIAGRLIGYKVIPRKTVKLAQRGSSSIGKVNFTDLARYTNKNKRGAFSITVSSGQNFF